MTITPSPGLNRLGLARAGPRLGWALLLGMFTPLAVAAQVTNGVPNLAPPLPELGVSLVRVMGALALVVALFLGGVWLYRNWQRLALHHGRPPKLNVQEIRPMGGRHALYVVAYEQQRFLLASSPAGIQLLTHLPDAGTDEPPPPPTRAGSFTQILARAGLSRP